MLFYIGVETTLDYQTLLHHVIAFGNYYLAFWQQDFTVTVGAAFLFLEISTPFVQMRWLYFHHGLTGAALLQNINTLLLFFFFIFGRVFVQLYIVWEYAIDWLALTWFHKEGVPELYKAILVEMAIAVLINMILNFYWSFLIVRQVWRMFTRGGKADKDFAGDEVDDDK